MIYTAVIRQRGQLTIPDKVRDMLAWLNEGEAVGLEIREGEMGILIRPKAEIKKEYDWDRIWAGIKRCRSYKPKKKQELSASEFVAMDRYNH